jgi:hypothetical protein
MGCARFKFNVQRFWFNVSGSTFLVQRFWFHVSEFLVSGCLMIPQKLIRETLKNINTKSTKKIPAPMVRGHFIFEPRYCD